MLGTLDSANVAAYSVVAGETVHNAGQTCQRLLTAWARATGGALELIERSVDLEHLGEVQRARSSDAVFLEAASKGSTKVSAAADTLGWVGGGGPT